jgi:hypothetical protein
VAAKYSDRFHPAVSTKSNDSNPNAHCLFIQSNE